MQCLKTWLFRNCNNFMGKFLLLMIHDTSPFTETIISECRKYEFLYEISRYIANLTSICFFLHSSIAFIGKTKLCPIWSRHTTTWSERLDYHSGVWWFLLDKHVCPKFWLWFTETGKNWSPLILYYFVLIYVSIFDLILLFAFFQNYRVSNWDPCFSSFIKVHMLS
jgi:hypothetical protein